MIDLIFVALFQTAAGEPAQEVEQPTEQPVAQQQSDEPAPGVHCRMRRLVGSRIGTRVCTTEAWDRANRDDARQAVDRAQRNHAVHEFEAGGRMTGGGG